MQLVLTLSAEYISLPVNNRPLIHGLIYHALSECREYQDELHNADPHSRSFKGFTFCLRPSGLYRIEDHMLICSGAVHLEIRSIHPMMITYLYHHFMSCSTISIGDQLLNMKSCQIFDRHIRQTEITVRMASPAVAYTTLENRHTLFYTPEDTEFYHSIIVNALRKNEFYRPDKAAEFQIAPDLNKPFKKQFSTFKRTYIEGWFADLILSGTPELLDILYQAGLGAKNSEGYGMFDILD